MPRGRSWRDWPADYNPCHHPQVCGTKKRVRLSLNPAVKQPRKGEKSAKIKSRAAGTKGGQPHSSGQRIRPLRPRNPSVSLHFFAAISTAFSRIRFPLPSTGENPRPAKKTRLLPPDRQPVCCRFASGSSLVAPTASSKLATRSRAGHRLQPKNMSRRPWAK